MATAFRDWPWPLQALLFLVVGAAVVLTGMYAPGSPVRTRRLELDQAKEQLKPLKTEVENLRVYEQQRAELQTQMDALQKQLATLQTIVPEDKEVDQFILMLQSAAAGSGVMVRRVTTKPIVARDYHYEMPFEVEADGPYYAVLDFFGKLGRLSRIINVGDLEIKGVGENATKKAHLIPNTSVTGTFTVITFFTKAAEQPVSSAGKQPQATH
jgi:Tfp pilus assembly protein PilO